MKKTVLSVEDATGTRRLIRVTLEYMGFHVLEAADGPEGLAMARQYRPDLVLMDVGLRGAKGLSACQTMCSDPVLRRIPMVMLSSPDQPADIEEGLVRSAKACLVKPFQPVELIELVIQLIEEADPTFVAAPDTQY